LNEGTTNADLCNTVYDDLLRELLQDHPWNFATKRTNLAADGTAPDWGYDYRYTLPSDCVRVLSIDTTAQQPQWSVENGYILTDEVAPLYISYISDDVTENQFPPLFVTALSLRIAVELAMPLTESGNKVEMMTKRAMAALAQARGQDARESGARKLTDETLINARL